MKKLYLFLAIACLTQYTFSQLTVTATAAVPTICAGNSTSLSATASPVGYTMSSIAHNPQPLQGVNMLADAGLAVTPLSAGNLDDGRWDNITLPFTFRYYGTDYNSIQISTNGWIGIGSSNIISTGMGFVLPAASAPNNVIHAITTDLNFKTPTTSSIEYFEDGSYPNRIFVISFDNIKFLSGGGTANVQVILYETTNIIEIHTASCTNTTLGKLQGIENGDGSVYGAVTGRNNTTNWTGTGMPNAFKFTPDQINYTWSPATGLSATTGAAVTATPASTTTYTVNAVNPGNAATGSNTVTVTISAASYTLAATPGGAQICQNISVVPGGTSYRDGNCNIISSIVPAGASPVSNSINTCIRLLTGAAKLGTTTLFLSRVYDIEPIINPSTSTANITLYYKQSEFDDFNARASDSGHKLLPISAADVSGISNVTLRQFHGTGTNPTNYTGASQDFTTATGGFTVIWNVTRSWWEVTVPVTGFSGFYLTSKKVGALAISLEYFNAVQISKKHMLHWKVNCTSAEAKFEIQRSSDGINYTTIGNITASQLRCNQPFDYTDESPLYGANYYRIKMVDLDTKAAYSNIVLLTLKANRFEMVSLNPNITSNEAVRLKVNTTEKNILKVAIIDFTGRMVNQQIVDVQPGLNEIIINSNNLSKGAYLVSCFIAGEKPQNLRLVKR